MTDQQVRARLEALKARLLTEGLSDAVLELAPLMDGITDPGLQGEVASLLAFCHVRQGRLAESLPYSDCAVQRLPANVDVAYNRCYALCQLKQLDAALAEGNRALARLGDNDLLLGLMTNLMAVSGRIDAVRTYGNRTLVAKNLKTAALQGQDPTLTPIPAFDARQRAHNIISFSLFGNQPRYIDPALWNAEAARHIYPGWTCRFYVDDSVPAPVQQRLMALGAQVLMPTRLPAQPWGTFWRFLVADDAAVQRYIVRDADSLINLREAAAVQAWLTSGCHFHVMRDHFDHSDVVLAGMWGGVRGALPPLAAAAQQFLRQTRSVQNRTADQMFLCHVMWPHMRRSLLSHDSVFGYTPPGSLPAQDFPATATLPPGCWVGGDARTLLAYGVG